MNKIRKFSPLPFVAPLVFSTLISGCSERKFTEFTIDDVSKEHYFLDSASAKPDVYHNNVSVIITGEIDSAATVSYASYPGNFGWVNYDLKKGKVKIETMNDYYAGDSLWIRFTPKGAKKGHLKIKTRIN